MTQQHRLPFLLTDDLVFPNVEYALEEPDGLLAIAGDLSKERLILAYQSGIFPWYSQPDPILWWSPDPRAILFLDELKVSRSLSKSIRNKNFEIWLNKDFDKVIKQCAASRHYAEGTWITEEMQNAYRNLHQEHLAHSISVYLDDSLIGGLYGISLGRFFFGESMFSLSPDASKVALYHLVEYLKSHDFLMIDCQVSNSHLESLGTRAIPRAEFIIQLEQSVHAPQSPNLWKQQILSYNPDQLGVYRE